MKGTIIRIAPVMQCPDCEKLKVCGAVRPGVDDLTASFFWKCDCGWKGLTEAVEWEGQLREVGEEVVTSINLYALERAIHLSAGDRIVKRYLISDSKDAFGEGLTSSWEVEEY